MKILFTLFELSKVNIYYIIDDGWIFMVMEYCNLGNIATIQAEKK